MEIQSTRRYVGEIVENKSSTESFESSLFISMFTNDVTASAKTCGCSIDLPSMFGWGGNNFTCSSELHSNNSVLENFDAGGQNERIKQYRGMV